MSEKQKLGQESAFPTDVRDSGVLFNTEDRGMSKRFYAACATMQGLLSNSFINTLLDHNPGIQNTEIVSKAYAIADELLIQENQ